jgi:hypothetical protein
MFRRGYDIRMSVQQTVVSPLTQTKYQVRLDLGKPGLKRMTDADVIIWVDSLGQFETMSVQACAVEDATIIAADLTNRTAAAQWVLEHQVRLGRRVTIAVVAAGREGAFASHDALAAGAVIDALATAGIDFTSPEAAVVCAAFEGLQKAVGHLFTASVVGQEMIVAGEREKVVRAAQVDTRTDVKVLRLAS